jgi:hypothetical protein
MKNIVQNKFWIVIALHSFIIKGMAQNTNDVENFRRSSFLSQQVVIPSSPEAVSLGKYGDAKASHYTGALNYNIPIYELKGKQLSQSISLSYEGAGNKVHELPSWVGLGWTLQQGGVVTDG